MMHGLERRTGIWRVSLEQIEATVADYLGSGRVCGNQAGPCLSRQVSMYLAKNVGGWSTTKIGRFYNGRHHSTVLHSIAKVEQLRKADESLDALIEVLTAAISPHADSRTRARFQPAEQSILIEAIATRVLDRILELRPSLLHSQGD